ncbi:hypothetical protein [Variovorax sp. V116]|uniref:hypothetical protein n=1 Tax=Variovorax sp. V116 TaxID=3065953 RepID=UPI0034E8A204
MEYQNAAALASTSRAEARARCAAVAYLIISVMGSLWFSGLFTVVWQVTFLACALPLAFMGAKAIHDAVLVRMLER